MDDFDDDPLDILEGDGDGVVETILLEEEDKHIQQRTECAVLLIGSTLPVNSVYWATGY